MEAVQDALSQRGWNDSSPPKHWDSIKDAEVITKLILLRHRVREPVLALLVADGGDQVLHLLVPADLPLDVLKGHCLTLSMMSLSSIVTVSESDVTPASARRQPTLASFVVPEPTVLDI